jgi:hypothetical protein
MTRKRSKYGLSIKSNNLHAMEEKKEEADKN